MKYGFTIRYPQHDQENFNYEIFRNVNIWLHLCVWSPSLAREAVLSRRPTEPLIAWKQEAEQRGRKGKGRGGAGKRSGALLIRGARKCQEIETMT